MSFAAKDGAVITDPARSVSDAFNAVGHPNHLKLVQKRMTDILRNLCGGAIVVLSASACADSPTALLATTPCATDVQIHASAGSTPDFTWTPSCRLFMVGVELSSSGHDLWFVAADNTSGGGGLTPPIRYGSVPPGAHLVETPAPPALQPGVPINALAFRLGGSTGHDTVLAGVLVVTP
jgi:hypothetical protein